MSCEFVNVLFEHVRTECLEQVLEHCSFVYLSEMLQPCVKVHLKYVQRFFTYHTYLPLIQACI